MKCTIPEISWHNKDPVLSVDIQPFSEIYYRLASGGTDSHILIWHLTEQSTGVPGLECVSDLTRHQKAVNVVRFSPSGKFLASGDDESVIIIWKQKTDQDPLEFPGEEENRNQEQWLVVKILRGHLEDIYDLSWSQDEQNIISGSVDNTAIIWDIKRGHMKSILRDHKSFVQGVAWDPASQLLATLSSDRICRFFSVSTQKVLSRVGKAVLPGSKVESKPVNLFHDDTMKSFFRRLCFTPCGSLIIAPAGVIEPQEPGQKAVNTTLIFTRNRLSRPAVYLPSYNQYSVAVRCCPKLFALRDIGEPPLFNLPYRVVFAIATQSSVLLYDTQHYSPFAYIANIHYTRLTDLTWSSDGKILIVSSTDGYCSIITFSDKELGDEYIQNQNKIPDFKCSSKIKDGIETKSVQNEEKTCSENSSSTDKTNLKVNGTKTVVKGRQKSSLKDDEAKGESPVNENDDSYELILEETVNDNMTNDGSTSKNDITFENVVESMKENSENTFAKSVDNNSSIATEKALTSLIKSTEVSNKRQGDCNENNDCKEASSSTNTQNSSVTPLKSTTPLSSPNALVLKNTTPPHNITPIEKRKPKRVQLITLSSPKSKKKL